MRAGGNLSRPRRVVTTVHSPAKTFVVFTANLDAALVCHAMAFSLGINPGPRRVRTMVYGTLWSLERDCRARVRHVRPNKDCMLSWCGWVWCKQTAVESYRWHEWHGRHEWRTEASKSAPHWSSSGKPIHTSRCAKNECELVLCSGISGGRGGCAHSWQNEQLCL